MDVTVGDVNNIAVSQNSLLSKAVLVATQSNNYTLSFHTSMSLDVSCTRQQAKTGVGTAAE